MCSKEEAVDRWLHRPQPPRVHVDYTRPGFVRPESEERCHKGHLMWPNPEPGPGRPEFVHRWAEDLIACVLPTEDER